MSELSSAFRARCAFVLLPIAALACDGTTGAATPRAATAVTAVTGVTASVAAVDPVTALDLSPFVTADYVAAHGSCASTQPPPSRSRLVNVLIPDRSTYLRLNVVTSPDGKRPEMIDLARGLDGDRIWYATLERGSRVIDTRVFANQGDKHPVTGELPPDGAAGRQLLHVATLAIELPCGR